MESEEIATRDGVIATDSRVYRYNTGGECYNLRGNSDKSINPPGATHE